jgi:digeranylgeranylglycerophospholipid reductase
VIGAGPCGSIAAISALRKGAEATITEEHPTPGMPENCSGLFSKEGLESLHPFLDYRSAILNPIRGAVIHFGPEKLSIRRKTPVAFVCDRSFIDLQLAEKAEKEGAGIEYGKRIRTGDFPGSQNIIGADGPLSTVARCFGFPKINTFAATLQSRFQYRSETPDLAELFFSNSLFPGFFAWVIPRSEDEAEFGVGVEVPNRAAVAWDNLLRLKKIPFGTVPKPRGALIPLETRHHTGKRSGKCNVVLVGDAAGQVKSTTGGGVIYGANCAVIAGQSYDDPLRYELEWRLRYGPDLAMHKWIHDHLASLDEQGISSLGRRLKRLNMDDYLSKSGDMDKPSGMLRPNLLSHMIKNIAGIV